MKKHNTAVKKCDLSVIYQLVLWHLSLQVLHPLHLHSFLFGLFLLLAASFAHFHFLYLKWGPHVTSHTVSCSAVNISPELMLQTFCSCSCSLSQLIQNYNKINNNRAEVLDIGPHNWASSMKWSLSVPCWLGEGHWCFLIYSCLICCVLELSQPQHDNVIKTGPVKPQMVKSDEEVVMEIWHFCSFCASVFVEWEAF